MNLKTVGLCISVIVLLASTTLAFAVTPGESLKKNFPNIPVDSITPSNVSGLYEVIAGQQVFYYAPDAECIVGGPIVTKEGKNLTKEKQQELEQKRMAAMALKIKDLPLDKAVKIGKGKNQVIEITDPDCPYCRKAAEFFTGRKDVTKYVFLYPLDMHKQAEEKVRYILCAKDKAKAYEQAMTGKLDDMKFKVCKDASVDKLVKTHKDVAAQLGVTGTPFFFINGRPVVGADIPMIERLLGSKDEK